MNAQISQLWPEPPAPRSGLAGEWDRFIGPGATRAELGLFLGSALVGAAAVAAPLYLQRPVAMALTLVGLGIGLVAFPPTPGMAWFVPVFYLKLLVSHLLREWPYAPEVGGSGCPLSDRFSGAQVRTSACGLLTVLDLAHPR